MYCPGATTPRVPFTVTGTATSAPVTDTKALLDQGTVNYGTYVEAQIGFLVTNVQPLVAAIKSGDLAAAKVAYAKARPYYERIEPVAESFQDLDPAIDSRADDGVAPTKLTGFHRIEYGLWSVGSVAGLAPVADKLTADVAKLKKLATGLHYQPAELANGAVELLDEVSKSKITGEEERYSHIDLLDFQANVEGSEQAFANLQPALAKIDSTLTDTISSRFAALDSLLDKYRDKSQPSGFVPYTSLSRAPMSSRWPSRCRPSPSRCPAWRARSSTRDRRAARVRAQPAPFPRRRVGRRGRGCGWGCGVRRRAGDRTQRRIVGLGPGAVLRRAAGGHRDGCAGPARVRGVRHHDHRRPGRADHAWLVGRGRGPDDRGRGDRTDGNRAAGATRRHR
jgi:hypothetical protein